MVIVVRVVVLALLSSVASALDQFGLFGCPADFKDQTDGSVSYATPGDTAILSLNFLAGGPYWVVAAAENEMGRAYSCIKLTATLTTFGITYYKEGVQGSASLTWNPLTGLLTGKLPEGMLGSPNADTESTFTVTSNKNGFVVLKSCRGGFLFFSHFVSTFVLADNTVDMANLNQKCLVPTLQSLFFIETWPKGYCP